MSKQRSDEAVVPRAKRRRVYVWIDAVYGSDVNGDGCSPDHAFATFERAAQAVRKLGLTDGQMVSIAWLSDQERKAYQDIRSRRERRPHDPVLLDCEGEPSCGAWVYHDFVGLRQLPPDAVDTRATWEELYRCRACGTDRRWGLVARQGKEDGERYLAAKAALKDEPKN